VELRSGYKQTEVGVIPEDWDVKLLGDIASVRDGTHQTPKYVPVGVPFYSVEHVTSGNFVDTKFISFEEHRFLTRSYKIERGDILMTRIGSIGDCKLVDWEVDASFYVSLALLKIKGASAPFVAQYSNSNAFKMQVELHSLASAIPKKINLGPISEVLVALPPTVEEQSAIATALGDVDALLAAQDALIAKKRAIKQGAMQELLTGKRRLPGFAGEWESIQLGHIADVSKGIQLHSSESDADGPYPHYNGGIAPSGFTSRFNTSADTIVISEGGNSCGYVQIIDRPFWCGGHCYAVAPRRSDNEFLLHALKGQQTAIMALRVGSGLPNVQKSALKGFELKTPVELAEQSAIGSVLTEMDREIDALETQRAKTAQLKQGMMQALLTGQIRLV